MDSRLRAVGGQATDGYEIYPDVDALQFMGRSPPGSVQEHPIRPEDSISMTVGHGRRENNVVSTRPAANLEHLGEETPTLSSGTHHAIYDWKWEILDAALAIGSLSGILVLLYSYKDRPTRQWHHRITINTVLSLLTTAIAATISTLLAKCLEQLKFSWFSRKGQSLHDVVILDEASRGWPDTLRLVFSIHPVHMATGASLLLILSLTIGPLVQQAVTIRYHIALTPTTPCTAIECNRIPIITECQLLDRTEAIFVVGWRWIVPPTVVVLASVLVLASTMIRTRHEYTRSPSALRFISLGAQIERASRTSIRAVCLADCTVEDLIETSKSVSIRCDADRWHIVRNL